MFTAYNHFLPLFLPSFLSLSLCCSAAPCSLVWGKMFYSSLWSRWLTVHNLQRWMINGKKSTFHPSPSLPLGCTLIFLLNVLWKAQLDVLKAVYSGEGFYSHCADRGFLCFWCSCLKSDQLWSKCWSLSISSHMGFWPDGRLLLYFVPTCNTKTLNY